MTNKEAKEKLYMEWQKFLEDNIDYAGISEAYKTAFLALEQEPCDDAVSKQGAIEAFQIFREYESNRSNKEWVDRIETVLNQLPPVNPQPKTGQYEKHKDHTDCIWYGSDSGCPVTCSQYRDGWNDAMDYIFKNGKGYQPYRHDG